MCPDLPEQQTMPMGRPRAERVVHEALVRRLLEDQHPDFADLPLTQLDSGWDNVIYRLGEKLTVRLPRREVAAALVHHEQTWLPRIADGLPLPVPSPVAVGRPTAYYPWPWSVLPWFEGESADLSPPRAEEAGRFADFLIALHQPAPAAAPANPVRGVPLRVREANTRERMKRLSSGSDALSPALESIWESALRAPAASGARWLHGDLHAQNVLVNGTGSLTAIIDWGDITRGDPATDLAGIWAVFPTRRARQSILQAYRPDPALLDRARGWAFLFGVVLTDSGNVNSPRHAAAGRRILERLEADSG
jgi:aminoglycoside phosphotransferase (APT) family kinase protein